MNGVVIIGEGEKDEAPMLFNGEQVGTGDPPEVDIAVDPIDGTRAYISGLPVWWSQLKTLAQNAAGNVDYPYLPDTAKPRVVVEARVTLSLYAGLALASLAVGSTILLWIWLIPAALGQPFLRLYLLAEHGRCPHVANMLENTRTTFTNRIVRWLAWNMPYHAEHHAYPAVPFHKLPEFHAHTQAHLRQTENGYAQFNRGYLAAIAAEAGAAPVK